MSHSAKVEMWIDAEDGKRYEIHTIGPDRGTFHLLQPQPEGMPSFPGNIDPTLGVLNITIDGAVSTNEPVVFWNCLRDYESTNECFQYRRMNESPTTYTKNFDALEHKFTIAKMICDQAEGKDCFIGPAGFRYRSDGWYWYESVRPQDRCKDRYKTLFEAVLARFPDKDSLTPPEPAS